MDKIVVIVIVVAMDIAWIAWLLYNYYIVGINIKENSNKNEYKELAHSYKYKYKNAKLCIDDLIKSIKVNFPQSTIKYTVDKEGNQSIEGTIAR